MDISPGYEPLATILQQALDQAQYGKGNRCHANGLPFMAQPIMTGTREVGLGGPAFQARKKILEAYNCQDIDRAITDLLGAINYTAAMVIYLRETDERNQPAPEGYDKLVDTLHEVVCDQAFSDEESETVKIRKEREAEKQAFSQTFDEIVDQPDKPKPKLIVKSKADLKKALAVYGYEEEHDGSWFRFEDDEQFDHPMFAYCGEEPGGEWTWKPEWLEEVQA